MMAEIKETQSNFGFADIYIAGCPIMARHFCMEFCITGLCVNIQETGFAYTGGYESGLKIGLINYARFPCRQDELTTKAKSLAVFLIEKMHQSSATVLSPCGSFFLSRRVS